MCVSSSEPHTILPAENCPMGDKPELTQTCILKECEGKWFKSDWSEVRGCQGREEGGWVDRGGRTTYNITSRKLSYWWLTRIKTDLYTQRMWRKMVQVRLVWGKGVFLKRGVGLGWEWGTIYNFTIKLSCGDRPELTQGCILSKTWRKMVQVRLVWGKGIWRRMGITL